MTDAIEALIIERGIDTIDAAQLELRSTHKEREPYLMIPTLAGNCYLWDPIFIDNILLAYATDKLTQFSEGELLAFRQFINFQDYHSTSALITDANNEAIGCTNPTAVSRSFVVALDGLPFKDMHGKKVACQNPSYEVINEEAWKSLDEAMMALYNCEEINDCNRDDDYEQVVPCTI